MVQLRFFDLKARKTFMTDKFTIVTRSGRRFAVAIAPSGVRSFRIIGKDFRR